MCPYLIMTGNAQINNARNNFRKNIVVLCERENTAWSVENCAVLNHSIEGVSCEVEWNKQLFLIIW